MKDVGNHTRVTPEQRQTSLRKLIAHVHESQKASDLLSEWGLEFVTGDTVKECVYYFVFLGP